MVSVKPDVEHCISILHALLDDVSIINGSKNTQLDKLTVASRTQREGFAFVSKTLPRMGAALDSALRTGNFECPTNFRRYKKTALPSFLKGLLRRVFSVDGFLLQNPDVAAIAELRQICYVFYKTSIPFTDEQLLAAEKKFKDVDKSCYTFATRISSVTHTVIKIAREFLSDLFRGFDPYDIVPSHGPGIVASGEVAHEKRIFSTKYRSIHNEYPYYRFFYVNSSHLSHCVRDYWTRDIKGTGINKVLFVPKDSRGPRTIACEPLEYQFVQQGLRKILYDHIETHPLTRGRINFTDQSINQALARYSSVHDPDIVTVDLKDASDTVSVDLVRSLFRDTPLLGPLLALRTPESLLPSGEVVALNKYAAMGSALCFPVEALVFYALLHGVQSFFEESEHFSYVYGDDIIIRKEIYDLMSFSFSELGISVNHSKSSTEGFFRESCGAEYYKGTDVTYIKARNVEIESPSTLASSIEFANHLFDRGYYQTAKYVEQWIGRKLKPHRLSVPIGKNDSGYLCYFTNRSQPPLNYSGSKFDKNYQIWKRKVPFLRGVTYTNEAIGSSEEHAEYYRKMTQGWSPSFVAGSYAKRKTYVKLKHVEVGT